MATRARKQRNYSKLIDTLLKIEQSTLAAYDEAAERIDNDIYRGKIEEFRANHARAVMRLSQLAEEIDLSVPGPGLKDIIATSKVVLAEMVGDGMILRAMETTEENIYSAYENASGNIAVGDTLYEVCDDHLHMVKRHIDWLDNITP